MKKIFFLLFFTITTSIFAQKVSKQLIAEYEDTLKVMAKTIMNGENETIKTEANNAFINLSPRYAMEALGMVLIAIVAFNFTSSVRSIESVIPILGALALGAQRMLPMLQLAYQGWSTMLGGRASLVDTLEFLDQKIPEVNNEVSIDFNKNIILKDISFR